MPSVTRFTNSPECSFLAAMPTFWFYVPRLFISAVLVFSAGAKLVSLLHAGFLPLHVLVSVFEMVLVAAVWLPLKDATWLWVVRAAILLITFSGYAIHAAWLAWQGVPNCGCFGDISVPPLVTLCVSLCLLASTLAISFKSTTSPA